ncbi:FtsQ [Salinibacter ruber DSM 13855]|uniref:FtsQ n=1 Tax=Salinibacter ruber (strain DSM 13855 / M31) TaxID=309807 RepID=Q2S4J9_SALRD|nr:FtsQ [Salinibacter ruber DSM 13855]
MELLVEVAAQVHLQLVQSIHHVLEPPIRPLRRLVPVRQRPETLQLRLRIVVLVRHVPERLPARRRPVGQHPSLGDGPEGGKYVLFLPPEVRHQVRLQGLKGPADPLEPPGRLRVRVPACPLQALREAGQRPSQVVVVRGLDVVHQVRQGYGQPFGIALGGHGLDRHVEHPGDRLGIEPLRLAGLREGAVAPPPPVDAESVENAGTGGPFVYEVDEKRVGGESRHGRTETGEDGHVRDSEAMSAGAASGTTVPRVRKGSGVPQRRTLL